MKAIAFALVVTGLFSMTACSSEFGEHNGPDASLNGDVGPDVIDEELRDDIRQRVDEMGLEPLEEPPPFDDAKVELGHNLFFDPVLSGSKDVNCATCHQMDQATADEFPLSAGTGFVIDEHGDRRPGPQLSFTPRTSTDLFNLGAAERETMFWDTRLQEVDDGTFALHERSYPQIEGTYQRLMPEEIDNLLAAQAMLPVHSRNEMRNFGGSKNIDGEDNDIAYVPDHHFEGTWRRLMDRLLDIPEYLQRFEEVYPEVDEEDLSFGHAANALAAFQIDAFTFTDSPWDRFLAGDDEALSNAQLRGADLFFGKAKCSTCHGGNLLTDQNIYNFGVPPKTSGPEPLDNMDLGAAHRSHAGPDDEFHFRTPPLRNVELTGPYMHNGVYETLEDVIHHKIDPVEGLWTYDASHLGPAFRTQVHTRSDELQRVEATLSPEAEVIPELSDREVDDLVAFMEALTDPATAELDDFEVDEVPSGLPLPDLEETSPANNH